MTPDQTTLSRIVARAARHFGLTLTMTPQGVLIPYPELAFYMATVDRAGRSLPALPAAPSPAPKTKEVVKQDSYSWEQILLILGSSDSPLAVDQIAKKVELSKGRTQAVLRSLCLAGKARKIPGKPPVYTRAKAKPGPVPGTHTKRRSPSVLKAFYSKIEAALRANANLSIHELAELVEPGSTNSNLKGHIRNRLNDLREQGFVTVTGKLHTVRYSWKRRR